MSDVEPTLKQPEPSQPGELAADSAPVADSAADSAAAGVSGNEAVARAAEQAKTTGGRNLPQLGGLPVDEDTANLRQGPNLNDELLALLPLIGVWRGEGHADTPESGRFAFGQQIVFSHDGGNYISYSSRTWRLDDNGQPAATGHDDPDGQAAATATDERESGFLRVATVTDDATGKRTEQLEFIITHAGGVVEILYGEPLNERSWRFESALTTVTTTGPATRGPGRRLYGLMPNNDLGWVDERVVDGGLHPRMSAQLSRWAG